MKRVIIITGILFFCGMFFLCGESGAWSVTVKNSCDREITLEVRGHHFFNVGQGCYLAGIKPGETKTCELPKYVPPVDIFSHGAKPSDRAIGTHCSDSNWAAFCPWDVKAEVVPLREGALATGHKCQVKIR
jgi:hypothetical protein